MIPPVLEESVLCSPATALPTSWLGEAVAKPLTEAGLLAVLQSLKPLWLPRREAENDERFRQWIPYVLLRDTSGRLAAYPRGGRETRLHQQWSLGLGGHINPDDAVETGDGWRGLLWAGLRRELAEEFPAAVSGRTTFLGLIHESRTAVGRVHLGAVFLHETSVLAAAPGPELFGLRWIPRLEVGFGEWSLDRFELWSRLALQLVPHPPLP